MSDDPISQKVDPSTGLLEIELPDGSVTFTQPDEDSEEEADSKDWYENLADKVEDMELGRIASEVIEGIDADMESRKEWLETITRGIDLLGIKLEKPRSDVGSSAPLEGMSTVRHPLLLEACLRGQANARGELLPTDGPVKVRNDGQETDESDQMAEALEKDMNSYLTTVATEYYPDTDRMLFKVWAFGMQFKKVYYCPLRQRPVSESVDVKDIVISDNVTDITNCGRITNIITMRPSTLKRMQILGVYRDVDLSQPVGGQQNIVDAKIDNVSGLRTNNKRPQDVDYTIYECYVELDLEGYEHKVKGKKSGLPLPYRVTIERDSRQVLDIRRNWREGDEQCLPKEVFVPYEFVPGLGFYGLGMIHILGNTTTAVTAAWREMLDAYMFANFPGWIKLKTAGSRQMDNQFRIPPGGAIELDGGMTDDIRKMAMPLPYKEPGPGMVQFIQSVVDTGQRLGATADTNVGEGKQDAPVGTTLALIEQSQKVMDAVHKRLHAAQAREFQLLRDLFVEHPECLMRNKKKQWKWDAEKLIQALHDFDLVPQADPNTPSHMHRLMKSMALLQLVKEAPGLFDQKKVASRMLRTIGVDDFDTLFAPPQAPGSAPPSPEQVKMEELMLKKQDLALKAQDQQVTTSHLASNLQDRQAERASNERLKILDLAKELAVHSDVQSQNSADRALNLMQTGNQNQQASLQRQHDAQQADIQRQHDARQAMVDRAIDIAHRTRDAQHALDNARQDRALEAYKINQQAKMRQRPQGQRVQ